jgi:hypothetical protein
VVESTGFENRQARNGLEGSNPSLSAMNKRRVNLLSLVFGIIGAILAFLSVFPASSQGLDISIAGVPAAGIDDSLARCGFIFILISFILQFWNELRNK